MADAAVEFLALARALKEAGETGLQRELNKAITDAAKTVTDEIRSLANLEEHLPDPYAPVLLSNLQVSVRKSTSGTNPGVTITAKAPTLKGSRGRAVIRLNSGTIGHPVFGRRSKANPRKWADWKYQEGGMRAGFFDDPVNRSGPEVRDQIEAAIGRVRDKIYAETK